MKLLTVFLLYSIAIKQFFLAYFKKLRCKLIPVLRFCYFSENMLSAKSYNQLSYVFVWLTGILLTIVNILIENWNAHFQFAFDWSNAAWPIWWLKQSIKPCKLNESVIAITNTSKLPFVFCLRVLFFESTQI